MIDRFGREIDYLRISVTDRCNLRCRYCMPLSGAKLFSHEDILSFEEITEVVKAFVDRGGRKIKLTGGEPLVRRGILKLVEMLAGIKGIKDLSMTTNGVLLAKFAKSLYEAGLHRVNVSLDTMDAEKFSLITQGGEINDVFLGVEEAQKAGLVPLKINCIVEYSSAEKDAQAVKAFADARGLKVQFIRLMNLTSGDFAIVENGSGGDCLCCNRLRLLSDGTVRPCLFSDIGFNVRTLGAEDALRLAVQNKPREGTKTKDKWMYRLGG